MRKYKSRTRRIRRRKGSRKQKGGDLSVFVKLISGAVGIRTYNLPDGSNFKDLKDLLKTRGINVYKGFSGSETLEDIDPLMNNATVTIKEFTPVSPRNLVLSVLMPHRNISSIQKMKPMASFNSGEASETTFNGNWKNYSEEQRQQTLSLLSEKLRTPIGIFVNGGYTFYSIPHVTYICILYGISLEEGLAKFRPETLDLSFIYICFGDIARLSTDPQPITALTPEARAIYEAYEGTDDEQIRAMMNL